MYSLFIDTHYKDIVLGLYKDGTLIDKSIKTSERNHSDYVMPMIKELIDNNNISVHDLGEILVINGPGSFTGVRLGVTIAKTLAYTLDIPIKSMTSLEMYAVSSDKNTDKLVTIPDIKGVFAGLYDANNTLKGELFYKANADFKEYVEENKYEDIIVESTDIDLDKIFYTFKSIEPTMAHNVNPIYIKVIEALKKND